jgi:guanine deaminase
MGNLIPCAGPPGNSPNVPFTNGHDRSGFPDASVLDALRGLVRYAVIPRFSVSCSDEMLAVCGELSRDGLLFTTHLNETVGEVSLVRSLCPWASDYLETCERYRLLGARSVFAHDVHPTDDELRRLALAGATVAHCPSSNAFLGRGSCALRRHLEAGVRVALATAAGAAGLGLADEVGDLMPAKSADFVLVAPAAGSTLAAVLGRSESVADQLWAVFTLAWEESIAEVRVAWEVVWPR